MAVFTAEEMDKYGGTGGGGFFSLRDDGDSAEVRFLYNKASDIKGHAVHEVEIDGRKRYVDCLRSYKDPIQACPLCESGRYFIRAKMFIQLFDEETGDIKVWERGKKYITILQGLCRHNNPLVGTLFEVIRMGKRGDMATEYTIQPITKDETTIEDLPEAPELIGSLILDKSFDEMNFFLDNGYFEEDEPEQVERPTRTRAERTPARDNRTSRRPAQNTQTRRRTPANIDVTDEEMPF